MSEFRIFLTLGFDHILDIEAYDHILFLVALCALYQFRDWRKMLVLVTAFTIGHSLTLALATLDLIAVRFEVVEFFIAATILGTGISNVLQVSRGQLGSDAGPERLFDTRQIVNYAIALFFGLIHGLGFSSKIKAMLMDADNLWRPLLGFNLGVELGQLIIVGVIFLFTYVLTQVLNAKHRDWTLFASGAAAGVSLLLMFERIFW